MLRGTRLIDHSELSDILLEIAASGVDVPRLNVSNYIPEYLRTKDDGTEVYRVKEKEVEVAEGYRIDTHCNVVNLKLLREKQQLERLRKNQPPVKDHPEFLRVSPVYIQEGRVERLELESPDTQGEDIERYLTGKIPAKRLVDLGFDKKY
ncbi:MAG: hypothetical protein ACMXYG_03285 [Candidatus Woesearchaeota archaeon]